MSEPPSARGGDESPARRPSSARRRASLSGIHMAAIFDDMRNTESSAYLLPIVRLMRKHNGFKDARDDSTVTKKDLQQLAVAWGLSKLQGFWSSHATEKLLMRALFKHAHKLEDSGEPAPFIDAVRRPAVVDRRVCGLTILYG